MIASTSTLFHALPTLSISALCVHAIMHLFLPLPATYVCNAALCSLVGERSGRKGGQRSIFVLLPGHTTTFSLSSWVNQHWAPPRLVNVDTYVSIHPVAQAALDSREIQRPSSGRKRDLLDSQTGRVCVGTRSISVTYMKPWTAWYSPLSCKKTCQNRMEQFTTRITFSPRHISTC